MKKIILFLMVLLGITSNAYAQEERAEAIKSLMALGMPAALATEVAGLATGLAVLPNNTYFVARNAADSANISVLKVDASDDTILNADASDVVKIAVAGTTEATISATSTTLEGDLIFSTAASRILPGATSFNIRNNADSQTNLSIADDGVASFYTSILIGSGVAAPAIRGGATSIQFNNNANTNANLTILDAGLIRSDRGDVAFATSGNTIALQEATAGAKCMGTATANGVTAVTVSTTCVTTASRIFISRTSAVAAGVTEPGCWATNIVNATSFDLDCNDAAENSTFDWIIIHEAA